MCGIAGVLYADAARPVEGATLRAMADAIAHRGPDAAGYWRQPGIGLAHRRLSIIDLAGGDQPMGNEDGTVQVVFNGEVYNYPALRERLIGRGHRLATRSDTEVLVHLYEDHGEELVDHLRGMFAFALWDTRQRRLVLARDRVGQKPLYVYRDHEKLLFASELKAILAHPNVDRTIDCRGLEDYLALGMIPGSRSILRRVFKLPAAHVVSLTHQDFEGSPRQYWQLRPAAGPSQSIPAWGEQVRAKLDETLQAHKISDVPVGAFLSGGVDSSVVVGAASAWGTQPLTTFAIGFQEQRFNELPYAAEVAEHFHCPLISQIVTCEAAASLDALVHYYDEPFADSSAIPCLRLAQLASQHVKVVLSGDGGDEAFGGYARYAHDLQEARWRERIPALVRRTLLRSLAQAWPKADWLPRGLRAKTRLTNLSLSPEAAYANTLSICRPPLRRRLLSADVTRQLDGHEPERIIREHYAVADCRDALAGMIAADVGVLLPDDFLTKVDRASMAYGLEVRPPLVDHELLELAATIPSELKVREGETKWLFKQTYAGRLPGTVTQRAKQGFEIPVDEWLRGPLCEVFQEAVLSPTAAVRELLDQATAQDLYRQHLRGVGRHGAVLWSLLVLGRWAERYVAEPHVQARR